MTRWRVRSVAARAAGTVFLGLFAALSTAVLLVVSAQLGLRDIRSLFVLLLGLACWVGSSVMLAIFQGRPRQRGMNREYSLLIPRDQVLGDAFETMFSACPGRFAPILG